MAFSFDAAERVRRHDPGKTLARRPDDQLPFVEQASVGGGLLLDTCVYIDQAKGVAPDAVQQLLDIRIVNHSIVAVQELMFSVGILSQADPRTPQAVSSIEEIVRGMPSHRLFTPDPDVLGRAAVYAGILGRTQGYANDNRMKALNDCVLFLQAEKLGLTLLTANVAEFDILLQIRPSGRVLLYRSAPARQDP